ncbi:MAG: 2-oxoglutarate dehydrogenase complex dihydrolipoyllysine-residue succinyltransferase [Alicyclobacillus herbarius]|uniref:2-oxoglutarate dehydrogenase complex dihydrolipoyllysine-residue succinyltransferase n=1 Tax=Alicyclobacillus herbarius TaxID=122960 RepID=UPI002354CAEF|nr:2-oxoglutarate dehydrogenase complex dihydrolipoyllysine-residue succinyltransferase [Alicyclobacillus herbarius]MCL6632776.1 2-oxoglutarate dehydrogenase complex dihydrolipoyllysine-residue succinyltransferase [Alicyclobacillus herbarius]
MSEIKVPELAESIVEGTIASWLKQVGDTVSAGEAVAELETDKVNVEIISNEAGVLQQILKQEGETVQVGETIAIVGEGAATGSATTAAAPSEAAPGAPQPAPQTPAANAEQNPGQEGPRYQPPIGPSAPVAADAGQALATPAARRLAKERGIDLTAVPSRDPAGRITAGDVAAAGQAGPAPAPAGRPSAPAAPPAPAAASASTTAAEDKRVERVPMSRRRQTIAKRLVEVQHTAAMLTTFNEVDMTAVMDVRKRRKETFKEQHGVGLGFMSFFTKAVVGALKAFPLLNAEIQGTDLLVKHYYDIGVAVSTEGGLVVPVVRDADRLTFAEIEREIARLAKKARENKLSLQDLQGGTFTITNGGVFGSLFSTPILNGPQVGILGMHGIKERPVAVNGQVEIRPMMYLALSYDHRIVDGAEAVQFLGLIKQMIEDPETLLLEG